ncbi:MAG TPA: flagellar filament capping protein FliD [Syntrophorhabdaceae bacterium]|nr:flagellar filament capping protein FliD [Syntrophorhabdaceae bacterium]
MAGNISLTGLTSNINWTNLINDMLNAKKASTITPLENKKSNYQAKLSAYQSFNSLLLSLKNYIEDNKLDKTSGYNIYKYNLTSSNTNITPEDVIGISLSTEANIGNYSIEVTSLAQAEKIASDAQTSKTTALGLSGTITVNSKEIAIETEDTLQSIASKINSASAGVTASILSISDTEHRLTLESQSEGAEGISLIDGSNILKTLGILDELDQKKNIITVGADASLNIDGYTISSSSNTVANAISGVTLTLKKTNTGEPIKLAITEDQSAISGKVSAMVSSINSILSYIKTQNTYSGEGSTSSPLMGDINLQMVRNNINDAVFLEVEGNSTYTTASSIGLTFSKDGTLSLNTTTFSDALSANRTEVINVLTQLGDTLKTNMNVYVNPFTGTLSQVEKSINETITSIDKRIDELNERFDRQMVELEKKYNSLELLISSSNLMKNWLTQQIDYMKKSNS